MKQTQNKYWNGFSRKENYKGERLEWFRHATKMEGERLTEETMELKLNG
jgi:hypothetical protein